MHWRTLFRAARPPFLILAPVCVFLGASTALDTQGAIDSHTLVLVLVGALCAHISVNSLNEYADFKSGLDLITLKTPFSGGSGALPADPAMASAVLASGLITLLITSAIGIYLVTSHGLPVLVIGAVGTVIILTYTSKINRWPMLCLIAPGTGFGLLMVAGTHYVLTQQFTLASWLAALVVFFLVNNLLLLNQYPDIEADRRIGRRHLPGEFGTRTSSVAYSVFSMSTYVVILAGIYYGIFPGLSLAALLPLPLSVYAMTGAFKHGGNIAAHQQYLGVNVAVTMLVPLILGISIIYGRA